MAVRARSNGRNALLPKGMTAFLKRRAGQLLGFFLVCLAGLFGTSLATYHPLDPSLNLAIEGPARNLLAYPGAVIADSFLQTFGIASVILIIVLLVWGIRSIMALPLKWKFLRFIGLGLSLILAASVASQWNAPAALVLPNSLGGAVGEIFLNMTYRLTGISLLSFLFVGCIFTCFSFLFLLLSTGFSFRQIGLGMKALGAFGGFLFYQIYRFFTAIVSWSVHRVTGNDFFDKNSKSPLKGKGNSFLDEEDDIGSEPTHIEPRIGIRPSKEISLSVTINNEHSSQDSSTTLPEQKAKIVWGENYKPLNKPQDQLIPEPEFDIFNESEADLYTEDSRDDRFGEWEVYQNPNHDLLDPSPKKTAQVLEPSQLEEAADHLKTVLEEYGVRGEVVTVRPGPVVTMYEFKPAPGIKTSRVIGLADDIARSMSALSARIAVIPGRNVIGIELPNPHRETVYLRELLESETYEKTTNNLALVLGKDIGGQSVIADLTRMPHLLVAGTTGSGKSVAINTMILSLLFRLSPDRCKFIMIDPKMLELSVYDGIPHLLSPVVTDPKKAVVALKWVVREMENRYRSMSKLGVRNIDGYNSRVKDAKQSGEMLVRRVQTGFDPDSGKPIFENQPLDLQPLPYIVVVVDEMADLMLVAGKDIESAVQRLAQMARAAGIHLIMATQRPSVDVITGTIKANFPTRISFQVTSKIDSRTILGEQGAEQLLGQGDMLYMAGGGRITRVHGPYVKDNEVERIVKFIKTQGEPVYIDSVTDDESEFINFDNDGGKAQDDLYNQAVELVRREGKASTSFIQRHLQIGYNKAAGIIESLEKQGVVSPANHVGKREVLL